MDTTTDDNRALTEDELRALFHELGVEYTPWNLLMLVLTRWGAEPNAALTLAECRRRVRTLLRSFALELRDADVFPIIRGLEKSGIFERVPGHTPVAWRTSVRETPPRKS